MPDSPRWCALCASYGDHHSDRCNRSPKTARELVEWLVSLDHPGSEERKIITLTQIIERAKACVANFSPEVVLVTIKAYLGDGNDPLEANARLPIIPHIGETLCVWVATGRGSGNEEYLTVSEVILNTWAPEAIEVYVSTDGHTDDDICRIMQAINDNDQP